MTKWPRMEKRADGKNIYGTRGQGSSWAGRRVAGVSTVLSNAVNAVHWLRNRSVQEHPAPQRAYQKYPDRSSFNNELSCLLLSGAET